jgi:hypothetical protein
MKKALLIFASLLFLVNLHADNTNENVGAWSDAVNGLRGRLVIIQEKEENGVQRPKVFLELQNAANVLDPIQISAFDPQTSFQCHVFDSATNTVASAPIGIREVRAAIVTLIVPFESSLRLDVNRHRMGAWFYEQAPPKERTEIVLEDGVCVIAKENRSDYFLEGTFHIEESKPATALLAENWSGALKIPAVKIPR